MIARLRHIPTIAAVGVLLLLYLACAIQYPAFREPGTLRNVLIGASITGIVSIGMTFVIISGGIDLSVGSILGFTSILISVLVSHHWHPILAWSVALGAGALAGAASGAIIHVFRIPAFIVTLGAMFLFRGLALLVSEDSVSINHPLYNSFDMRSLAVRSLDPIPPIVILFGAAALVAWILSRWTRFGRTSYAIGAREHSARLMGLPVASTRIRIYAFSGACAALAGIATTMHTGAGDAGAGHLAELDAIAAVVIGGTPLSGGIGTIPGTLAGVLITSLIQELITFSGVTNSWWSRITIGALLLLFILLQRLVQARAQRFMQGDRA